MVANHPYTRLDILEIQDMICRKIGEQRAEKYFDQLRTWFRSQLTKIEFDELCIKTIGRENIRLHNRLITSLIKNAYLAKVPPPKVRKVGGCPGVRVPNGYRRSSVQSLGSEAFPQSPRRSRSPVYRDRRYQDHRSPLGPLGKSPNTTGEEVVQRVQEQQSATELHSLASRPPVEATSVEDGEEVEQFAGSPSIQSRNPVTAPLGISMNRSGSRKSISSGFGSAPNVHLETCQRSGQLPDTRSLRSRLEKKLQLEGVAVPLDCANVLNNGLDAYLRRLIEPYMAIAGARCRKEHVRHINGLNVPGHINRQTIPGLNEILQGTITRKQLQPFCGSILDFRVAMESNPRLLGEDWAVQLERICIRSMEE